MTQESSLSALLADLQAEANAAVKRNQRFGKYTNAQDALRALSRHFFNLSPNQVRTHYGIEPYKKSEDVADAAIRSLLSQKPITRDKVMECICALPARDETSQTKAKKTLATIKAEGMLKFMHLARASMKHGGSRLSDSAIVSELQNEFVMRAEITKFNDKAFYRTREWKELRLAVLSAMPKCCLCGAGPESGPLHVDHIKPRSLWPELSLSPSNMQTLCGPCNLAKSNVVSIKY